MRNSRWALGLLIVVGVTGAGCGPAPGYGVDGRRIADPSGYAPGGYDRGPARGQSTPGGYVANQPQPNTPVQNQAPVVSVPSPAAADQGMFLAPPYAAGQAIRPEPIAPDPGLGSPAVVPAAPAVDVCDDTCRFANNGECDDGRAGSDTDVCAAGTDCRDCGTTPH